MKLEDCNKKELLYIIEYLKRRLLGGGESYVESALADVEWQRTKARLDEADELLATIIRKREKIAEIITPYKNLGNIPRPVLADLAMLEKEVDELDHRWERLTKEIDHA